MSKVDKRVDKENKKGCLSVVGKYSLTRVEEEVLQLLTGEFLTQKQISVRRKCSRQAVSKVVKRLKNKGALNLALRRVDKGLPTCQPCQPGRSIRLHGQEFCVRLLFKGDKYFKARERGNVLQVDGNTVRLHRDSLEVYSGKSFFGESVRLVTVESFEYWGRFLARLEHDLGVVLVKSRAQNVRLVNQHYAEVGNELAGECLKRGVGVRVFTRDDGKLWFVVDDSFNFEEAECVHPETAQEDMGSVVRPFFEDLRSNRPPLLSDVMRTLDRIVSVNEESACGLRALVRLHEPTSSPDEGKGVEGVKREDVRGYK